MRTEVLKFIGWAALGAACFWVGTWAVLMVLAKIFLGL